MNPNLPVYPGIKYDLAVSFGAFGRAVVVGWVEVMVCSRFR